MRNHLLLCLVSLFIITSPVFADSANAYKDYLFQFDTYRTNYSAFTVAKTEYKKFKTLTSETTALETTKTMLTSRDQLLRAYLYILNEKLNEDTGLNLQAKGMYQSLIRNEVTFLENHALLIPSIAALSDAESVSQQLESHYTVLQGSIRQIIVGISLGNLNVLSKNYDTTLTVCQNLVGQYGYLFPPSKQSTINRWILQITNKRTLYQQKINSISQAASRLQGSQSSIDSSFQAIGKDIAEARQYLLEGTSYMNELLSALRYQD